MRNFCQTDVHSQIYRLPPDVDEDDDDTSKAGIKKHLKADMLYAYSTVKGKWGCHYISKVTCKISVTYSKSINWQAKSNRYLFSK